jgi:alpha-L-rhamnosidase
MQTTLLSRSRLVLLFFVVAWHVALAQGAISVEGLRCEYRENPLAIDTPKPHLGWRLHSDQRDVRQSAYQVLVASNPQSLEKGEADLWDSGKVEANESVQIPYAGKARASRTACCWKVRVWDQAGAASDWSQTATWEVGLLSSKDWQGTWLNDGKANPAKDEEFYREDPAPLFRKEFNLPKQPVRARLYVSGLGYYEANLNGQRVGDQVLDPGWTRYSQSVLYSAYDVTSQLRAGANCLGVALGNGWYNPLPLRMWGNLNLREHLPVGRPRFIAHLEAEFADGTKQTVASDPTWRVTEGPIRFNSVYLGEIYDARKEISGWDRPGFDDSGWRQPAVAAEPIGPLQAQMQPPIRVTKALRPLGISQPKPGVFIYDLGQNYAGWVTLKLAAPAGTKITLRYGELLDPDGTLNPLTSVCGQIKGNRKNKDGKDESIGGPGAPTVAWQSDTYIARGNGAESYTPKFTFRGFRYVELTGLPGTASPDMVTGSRLNADVARAGSFACSDPLLNRIQEMCDWTFLSNLFSVQSDCPHREKFGYGGDIGATSEALMMNYDMATFYAKTVRDWKDSALPDGLLPDTAPFVGLQYCGVAWGIAHPLLLRQLYQYYGNRQLIEEQFPVAQRWLDRVAANNPSLIIPDGLSDHEGLASAAPAPVMVTPLFAASARIVAELASILGRASEAAKYQRLAAEVRMAYLDKFFDSETGKAGPGTQASQAFALYEGLISAEEQPAALQRLMDDIRGSHQHLTTGIYGTKFMLDFLSREGHADLAYAVAGQKDCPGWGYMLDKGATTLWEHWEGSDNTYSHNHPMFGSVSQWLYHWVGGIQPDPEAIGFDRIIIRPQPVKGLDWANTSYQSVRGKIVSNWRRDGRRFRLDVEIPGNASARVYLPAQKPEQVTEGGKPAAQSTGVEFVRVEAAQAIYRIGSGRYQFEVSQDAP